MRHVWQVGPIPLKTDGNTNSSTVYALGEAAVDFDIAPAVNVAEMQTNMNNTLSGNATIREQNMLMNSTRLSQVTNKTVTAANETSKVSI